MKDKLVFFGTGPVSRAAMEVIGNTFEIEAVITKPDAISPSGRVHSAPVKELALEHNLSYYQPGNRAELESLFSAERFSSQLGLVVDYGLIIPESVIQAFPLGIVNSHFSLLPEWRGADPITAAILSGQQTTGVSLMLIVPKLDEGPLLAQEKYSIPPKVTISDLTSKLTKLSNKMLQDILPKYFAGEIKPFPQDSAVKPTYSRKLTKADGQIAWSQPAEQIERQVRAYLGWPGSRTQLAGTDVTISAAHISPSSPSLRGGTTKQSSELRVKCGDGRYLVIDRLKPAGKRDMTGPEFLAGHSLDF